MTINLNKTANELLDNIALTSNQRVELTKQYNDITSTLKKAIKESKTNYIVANYLKDNLSLSVDKSYLYTVLLHLGYEKKTALHPFISTVYNIDPTDLLTPKLDFASPNKTKPIDLHGVRYAFI